MQCATNNTGKKSTAKATVTAYNKKNQATKLAGSTCSNFVPGKEATVKLSKACDHFRCAYEVKMGSSSKSGAGTHYTSTDSKYHPFTVY